MGLESFFQLDVVVVVVDVDDDELNLYADRLPMIVDICK